VSVAFSGRIGRGCASALIAISAKISEFRRRLLANQSCYRNIGECTLEFQFDVFLSHSSKDKIVVRVLPASCAQMG